MTRKFERESGQYEPGSSHMLANLPKQGANH
jgi:hypothetical protein